MKAVFYLKSTVHWVQDFILECEFMVQTRDRHSGVKLHKSPQNAVFNDRTFAFLKIRVRISTTFFFFFKHISCFRAADYVVCPWDYC